MKKFLLLAIALISCAAGAQARTVDEVFAIMQRLAPDAQVIDLPNAGALLASQAGDDKKAGEMLGKIKGLKILQIDNPTAEQKAAVADINASPIDGFEQFLTATDDGQDVAIYTLGDGTTVRQLLIVALDEDKGETDLAIVLINGEIDVNNINDLVKITQ